MKDDIKAELDANGAKWRESEDLLGVASEVDVLYQTRIQKERFGDRLDEYEACRGVYTVDEKVMAAINVTYVEDVLSFDLELYVCLSLYLFICISI